MVPIAGQELEPEEIYELMVRAAGEDSVTVRAATTGLTSRGSDLGGFQLSHVEKPEVLLATGRDVSSNDSGEYWHPLDHDMNIPVSLVDVSEMPSADIRHYTHIILPGGNYGSLNEAFRARLDAWVRAGGVLIASESASRWVAEHDLSSATFLREREQDGEAEASEADLPDSYDDITTWDAEVRISGALFETRADVAHPLASDCGIPCLR